MAKVLVVDDEADAREFVRAIMEGEGWDVIEAEDGESGLAAVKSEKPDLVVLDVQMPGMDGFGMFGELVKNPETQDLKVIMLTGVGQKVGIRFSSDAMGQFLGKEPAAYVEKPIDPAAFKRVVAKVAGG